MSNPENIEFDEKAKKRLIRGIVVIGVLLLLFTLGSSFARLYANFLWYSEDAGAAGVFWTPISTKFWLFLIGFVAASFLLIVNAKFALRSLDFSLRIPRNQLEAMMQDMAGKGKALLDKAVWFVIPVIGIFYGISLSGRWEDFLRSTNGVAFGKADPVFGMDYSFFVFSLPYFQSVISWVWALWFLAAVIAVAIHLGLRGAASVGRNPLSSGVVRSHLSVLAAMGFLLLGVSVWLSRYGILNDPGIRFTGPGYSELQGLGGRTITAVCLWISAVLAIVNIRAGRPMFGSLVGAIASLLIFVGGVVVYPGIVQNYTVSPNEVTMQKPYIARAIESTRWSYGIDKFEVREFEVETRPTQTAIKDAESTLKNMRLWDPEILRRNLEVQQSLRGYYSFTDVDVDRYVIDGEQRMVMVGARDLVTDRLDENRKTWQNLHLQYTHGNGIVAVPVNESDEQGMPKFFAEDIPIVGKPEFKLDEARIYYSDSPSEEDRYVLVRSKLAEFDYSRAGEVEYRWTHDGGIKVGSSFRKWLFAWWFNDWDILFSKDITSETRLLWRRNVKVRAQAILHFLQWDRDPYIAVINKRLVYILDGYTTTDEIPYSAMTQAGTARLNYIRNSIKFTVDAYTGNWNAYITDKDDPIIQTYKKIYPGVLKESKDVTEELRAHFRYPEDIFSVQATQLRRYHVTDPLTFFRDEDAWEIPNEKGIDNRSEIIKPYYVQMRLPDEKKDGFVLILPFSPVGRPNMISWLAAHCDADDYGRVVLYRFPRDKSINGPEQQESQFATDVNLSKEITLIGQVGSRVISGNLLVVPLGKSVIYAKTLFLVSEGTRQLPQLKLVVLAYSDKVVFAENYSRALALLTGGTQAPTAVDKPAPNQPAPMEGVVPKANIQEALRLLEEGDAALRKGDWSAYGAAQKRLKELLEKAASK